ncbi:GNAT family N-acetyltransferase [Guptibacillus hwajinpoensis]|uniref:GNAT family N-acetyltransferase n=1 Tax=Guptibacillus hwajinpoensis TaxID=208199 RepID=UPI001CFF3564|nr:GNAT family N-acetyltransferase [Pseudalkalibacillus hwajinpoensis]
MIFYPFNPEFDHKSLKLIRSENGGSNDKEPSPYSTIYLFEEKDQTVGYLWFETGKAQVELMEFYFKGEEEKRWGLYDFIVKLAKKQNEERLRMRIPATSLGEKFLKKWEGKVVERDERELRIEIPFLRELA